MQRPTLMILLGHEDFKGNKENSLQGTIEMGVRVSCMPTLCAGFCSFIGGNSILNLTQFVGEIMRETRDLIIS